VTELVRGDAGEVVSLVDGLPAVPYGAVPTGADRAELGLRPAVVGDDLGFGALAGGGLDQAAPDPALAEMSFA
jgi:hypothetical protein